MFSLEKFYDVIYKNLLDPLDIGYFYFSKFGSLSPDDFSKGIPEFKQDHCVLFYDQEPIYQNDLDLLSISSGSNERLAYFNNLLTDNSIIDKFLVFANSEHSEVKTNFLNNNKSLHDWYYFFHGFAALDWYRNIQYLPPNRNFNKVFMSFNNLYTEKRSYRLNLISRLIDWDLHEYGHISLPPKDLQKNIKQEIFSPHCLLSVESKKLVMETLMKDPPELIIDTKDFRGSLSAEANLDVLAQGLFHIVTETVFYDSKLHLTEKIFKPIVARRPFMLVGAPGNLAYLKSYGFKTFDRWIDESYDQIIDPDWRIKYILLEIDKLCSLSRDELLDMYVEMWDVLDYNFNWFYTGFKEVIVDEMIRNFETCTGYHSIFDEAKTRLAR